MHKLKKYWEQVSADPAKIREMEEIACEALEEIRGRCPRLFWETAYKLHCVAYGPHFDEELAKKAVSKMKNIDGTTGEHWTFEQTSQLADRQGIHCKADWYFVMNMLQRY